MSERDDRYVGNDLPRNTGEFRAAPDASASTAEFRAFFADQSTQSRQAADEGSWPEQPWPGESPRSGQGRTIAMLAGIVIAVVIVIVVLLVI
ncbi:MAG TPA: hypothetical protein VFQ44_10085 [Streptosporangiaceae bacterium]|nr:hypothetical protein [Streptosporangiaceae bacterium]